MSLLIKNELDQASAKKIQELCGLSPDDINDAIWYLEDVGALDVLKSIGTAPYKFAHVLMKSRGKYLYHEIQEEAKEVGKKEDDKSFLQRPFNPVGSPYGFTEDDWISISIKREDRSNLYVVFGLKFESDFYNAEKLINNMKNHFKKAIKKYCEKHEEKISLKFEKLEAEYGGHLFNPIASKIIGSDIAIFEASNQNPNVMIELGVALTWGISILPLIEKSSPTLPSDISGQTWLKYEKSGEIILEDNFDKKLEKMMERAILKKGREMIK